MKASDTGEFARGWPILAGSIIGIGAGISSLYFYSLGIFIKPLADAFGWSRATASLGALVGTFAAAAAMPLVGRLADRIGSLRLAIGSLLLLTLGFIAHAFLVAGLTSFLFLTAAINACAAGSSPLPYTRLTAAAFHRHRGLALGIILGGTGLGAMLIPALLTPYIASHGWRSGYLALALASAVAIFAIIPFLARAQEPATGKPAPVALRRLVATKGFVPLGLLFFLAAAAILGTVVHFVPMLTDLGLSPVRAGGIAGLIGVAAIIGRLVIGWLIDRLSPNLVTGGVFVLAAVGLVTFASGGVALAVPGALITGLVIGAEVDLLAFHTARYFPRHAFGQANGLLYALFLIGGGIGPVLSGLLYDLTGGYHAFPLTAAGLLSVAGAIGFRLPAADLAQ